MGDNIWIRAIIIYCNKPYVSSNIVPFFSLDHNLLTKVEHMTWPCSSMFQQKFRFIFFLNWFLWNNRLSIFSSSSTFPSWSLAPWSAQASNLCTNGGVNKSLSTSTSEVGDTSLSLILAAGISIYLFFFSLFSFSFPFWDTICEDELLTIITLTIGVLYFMCPLSNNSWIFSITSDTCL